MFYSLLFLLYPIWIRLYQKHTCFHLKSVIISNDLEYTSNNDDDDDDTLDDKLVFISKKQNNYDGFDLRNYNKTNNNTATTTTATTTIATTTTATTELQKIANYFRKLKQLQLLNSPFVSDICKLKCAQEVLEEVKETFLENEKNDFWETYEDMFF